MTTFCVFQNSLRVYTHTHTHIHTYVYIYIYIYMGLSIYLGFSGRSVVKNLPAIAGDMGLMSGLGRFPGERNGNPFQHLPRKSIDSGARQDIVHGVAE